MQFRQDRQQDEKDMAFKTSGVLDEREAFAYGRNDNMSSMQLHDPYGVGKLSLS